MPGARDQGGERLLRAEVHERQGPGALAQPEEPPREAGAYLGSARQVHAQGQGLGPSAPRPSGHD